MPSSGKEKDEGRGEDEGKDAGEEGREGSGWIGIPAPWEPLGASRDLQRPPMTSEDCRKPPKTFESHRRKPTNIYEEIGGGIGILTPRHPAAPIMFDASAPEVWTTSPGPVFRPGSFFPDLAEGFPFSVPLGGLGGSPPKAGPDHGRNAGGSPAEDGG